MDAFLIGACLTVAVMVVGAGFDLRYQIRRERKAIADYRIASRLANGKLGEKGGK